MLGARGIVQPQLSFCHLHLSGEWFCGSEASCKGRLEASEFFRELVIWGHSLLVLTVFYQITSFYT